MIDSEMANIKELENLLITLKYRKMNTINISEYNIVPGKKPVELIEDCL